MLDVGQLIRGQIPDVNGKTIPPSTMSGSYDVKSLTDKPTDGLFEGKLVNKTYGYAVHGCVTCCPEYDERFIVQDPLNLLVGGSNNQAVGAYDACHNQSVQLSTSSWDTADPSIATAVANPDGKTALVTGKAAGSTIDRAYVRSFAPDSRGYCRWWTVPTDGTVNVAPTISHISPSQGMVGAAINITVSGTGFATGAMVNAGSNISVSNVNVTSSTQITARFTSTNSVSAGGNQAVTVTVASQNSNSQNFFVQVPTSLSIVSGTSSTTPEASCSAGTAGTGCGVARTFTYQVNDQSGQPIQFAGLQVWDAITLTSPNNLGITGFQTTCPTPNTGPCGATTNSSGQFSEQPGLTVCSTVCRMNNACIKGGPTNANQTVHVGSFSIVQQLSYYCDHVTVNGQ